MVINWQIEDGDLLWVAMALNHVVKNGNMPAANELLRRLQMDAMTHINDALMPRGWSVVDTTSDAR